MEIVGSEPPLVTVVAMLEGEVETPAWVDDATIGPFVDGVEGEVREGGPMWGWPILPIDKDFSMDPNGSILLTDSLSWERGPPIEGGPDELPPPPNSGELRSKWEETGGMLVEELLEIDPPTIDIRDPLLIP